MPQVKNGKTYYLQNDNSFAEQQRELKPINDLLTSGQYRDIGFNPVLEYRQGAALEDITARIQGTPVYDPTKGPQIDTGSGPQSSPIAFNPSGQGFFNADILKNQTTELTKRVSALPPYVPGPVTSEALKPAVPIPYETPKTPPIPSIAGLGGTAATDTTSETALSKPEQDASDLSKRLKALNDSLIGESAYRKEQEATYGISEKAKTVSDLTAQLTNLKNEAAAIPLKLEEGATGRGITTTILGRQEQSTLRQNAIQALSVSAMLEAARGNLALANDLVDRAVAAKYDPVKEQIRAATANLDLVIKSPEYTLAEKKRAQEQKDKEREKDLAVDLAKQSAKDILSIGIKAAENGADALTLRAIQNAKTPQDALALAGSFLKDETWSDPYSLGGDLVQKNSRTGEVRTAVNVSSGGGSTPAEAGTVLSKLTATRGADGYIDPQAFAAARTTAKMGPDEFNKRFSYLLSPAERASLGIKDGAAVLDFGSL